jgi:hypothetical protein
MDNVADIEERALAWLLVEIKNLLRELNRAGLSVDVQEEIATNYLFGLTCRLDGAEEADGAALAFTDDADDEPFAVHLVRPAVSLHEAVHGTVSELLGR